MAPGRLLNPPRSGAWDSPRWGNCWVGAAQVQPRRVGPGSWAGVLFERLRRASGTPPPPPAETHGLREGPERRALLARLRRSARPRPGCFPSNGTSAMSPAGNDTSPESFLLHNALARKPKRIRTAFSPSQLLRLEHAFEKNHYVVGAERKQLAHSLSLTETQVSGAQARRTLPKSLDSSSWHTNAELREGLQQRARALVPRPGSGCKSFKVPGFLGLQQGTARANPPQDLGARQGRSFCQGGQDL